MRLNYCTNCATLLYNALPVPNSTAVNEQSAPVSGSQQLGHPRTQNGVVEPRKLGRSGPIGRPELDPGQPHLTSGH